MVDYMLSVRKYSGGWTAISVLCIFLFVLLFLDSETASEQMRRGMRICFETLVPSLFPFMVISELLVRSGACEPVSRLIGRPMKALFGVSGECASALLLGIVCGFPVGAKAAASLYARGDISKKDCEHLLSFCNFPSAPFVIFAVGEGMFGSKEVGILLYCTVLFSGLLYGMLFRRKNTRSDNIKVSKSDLSNEKALSLFSSSVVSAASSVISVCAFVTFFTCFVGCISSLFGAASSSPLRALLFSFFELTSGCAVCTSIAEPRLSLILAAAACGWSGLSVFLQIYSLTRTEGESLSLVSYIRSKVFCSIICALVTATVTYIFPSFAENTNFAEDAFSSVISYPQTFTVAVNIIFALALVKLLDRKRKI